MEGEEVDLGDGEICTFPTGSTISECSGACPSYDRSPLQLLDTGKIIQHEKDCKCCTGSGSYRRQDLLCGEEGSSYSISVMVMHFDNCQCEACVSSEGKSINKPKTFTQITIFNVKEGK